MRWLLFCALARVAHADPCELQGTAIARTLLTVDADDDGRSEPYYVEDVPASAELGAEGAQIHVRSPIDFHGSAKLDHLTAYAQRRVFLAGGLVELQPGAALQPRQQGGNLVFDSWLGPFTLVGLSPPCDALTLDPVASQEPHAEERPLERRSLKPGMVELSAGPDAEGVARVRVAGGNSVAVLERRGQWRRIQLRSSAVRLSGWVRQEQLGPARQDPRGWARGSGGVTCDRPPVNSPSAVRASVDADAVVRIGSADGRQIGTVTSGAGFEVELDPEHDAALIHRAPRLEGGCAPEASLDTLWVPLSAVHPDEKVAPRTRAENFLAGFHGIDSLSSRYDEVRHVVHWTAALPTGKIDCFADNREYAPFRCEQVDAAGRRAPTPVPAWAQRLEETPADPLDFQIYSIEGLPVFDLDGTDVHLALRDSDGDWLLTPTIAQIGGTWTKIEGLKTLAQSKDGRERLVHLRTTTRGGTRWYAFEDRLFYFRIIEKRVVADSLPVGYLETFDHNEVFGAPKGHVSQTNRVETLSPRSVIVRSGSRDAQQLRRFCSAEELRTGTLSETSACNADRLRAVGEAVGRWRIENDRFVKE